MNHLANQHDTPSVYAISAQVLSELLVNPNGEFIQQLHAAQQTNPELAALRLRQVRELLAAVVQVVQTGTDERYGHLHRAWQELCCGLAQPARPNAAPGQGPPHSYVAQVAAPTPPGSQPGPVAPSSSSPQAVPPSAGPAAIRSHTPPGGQSSPWARQPPAEQPPPSRPCVRPPASSPPPATLHTAHTSGRYAQPPPASTAASSGAPTPQDPLAKTVALDY